MFLYLYSARLALPTPIIYYILTASSLFAAIESSSTAPPEWHPVASLCSRSIVVTAESLGRPMRGTVREARSIVYRSIGYHMFPLQSHEWWPIWYRIGGSHAAVVSTTFSIPPKRPIRTTTTAKKCTYKKMTVESKNTKHGERYNRPIWRSSNSNVRLCKSTRTYYIDPSRVLPVFPRPTFSGIVVNCYR